MNTIEIPLQHSYFYKDETGGRQEKEIAKSEFPDILKSPGEGRVIVAHAGPIAASAKMALIEILKRKDIKAVDLLIYVLDVEEKKERNQMIMHAHPDMKMHEAQSLIVKNNTISYHPGSPLPEHYLQEEKKPFIIQARPDMNMPDIHLTKEQKTHPDQPNYHHASKVRKGNPTPPRQQRTSHK